MLRKEDRALFIALLAIAAAIILCWAVPAPAGKEENSSQKCTTHECREDAATEAVAYYTGLLAWFTAALVLTAFFQGFFLIRADRATRRSIDLARDEFLASHRPKIRVRWLKILPPQIGNPITIQFALTNVGDGDAIGISGTVVLTVGKRDWLNSFSPKGYLPPGGFLACSIPSDCVAENREVPWIGGNMRFKIHLRIGYSDRRDIVRQTGLLRWCGADLNRFYRFDGEDIRADYDYED